MAMGMRIERYGLEIRPKHIEKSPELEQYKLEMFIASKAKKKHSFIKTPGETKRENRFYAQKSKTGNRLIKHPR